MNGSRLTGLTCSKAPGFWMVEHQLVLIYNAPINVFPTTVTVANILCMGQPSGTGHKLPYGRTISGVLLD